MRSLHLCLLLYPERSISAQIGRTSSQEDCEFAWFDDVLHFPIPESHITDVELDADFFRLSWLEEYFFEAFELDIWNVDCGDHVFDVELDDFGAGHGTGVCDFDGSGDGIACGDVRGREGNCISIGEVRVAESEAEWEPRIW